MVVIGLGWIIAPRAIRAAARFVRTAWNFMLLRVPVPGMRGGVVYAPLIGGWNASLIDVVRRWLFENESRHVTYAGYTGWYRREKAAIQRVWRSMVSLQRENRIIWQKWEKRHESQVPLTEDKVTSQKMVLKGRLQEFIKFLSEAEKRRKDERGIDVEIVSHYLWQIEYVLDRWRDVSLGTWESEALPLHEAVLQDAINDLQLLRTALTRTRRKVAFKIREV